MDMNGSAFVCISLTSAKTQGGRPNCVIPRNEEVKIFFPKDSLRVSMPHYPSLILHRAAFNAHETEPTVQRF